MEIELQKADQQKEIKSVEQVKTKDVKKDGKSEKSVQEEETKILSDNISQFYKKKSETDSIQTLIAQNYSQEFVNKRPPINVRIKQRIWFFCVIPVVTVALFLGLYFRFKNPEGTWLNYFTITEANFNIKMQNCVVDFRKMPGVGELIVKYYMNDYEQEIPRRKEGKVDNLLLSSDETNNTTTQQNQNQRQNYKPQINFQFDLEFNTFDLTMFSRMKDVKWCHLQIFYPEQVYDFEEDTIVPFMFGNITMDCGVNSNCYFVQDGGLMSSMGTLNFTGQFPSDFNINIEDIAAQGISFNGDTGSVYLNRFDFPANLYNKISLGTGQVLLQSEYSFLIDYFSPFNTICFSGSTILVENTTTSSNPTCQSVLRSQADSELITLIENNLDSSNSNSTLNDSSSTSTTTNSKDCSGVVRICQQNMESRCQLNEWTPMFRVLLSNGNIYGNVLKVDNPIPVSDYTYRGKIYDSGIDLADSYEASLNIEKLSDQKGNDIYILGIGKMFMRASNYLKWVFSQGATYSKVGPWWLQLFSLNIISSQTRSLEGFISPGFCPRMPTPSLSEIFELQKLVLRKLSNDPVNNIVNFIQLEKRPYPDSAPTPHKGVMNFSTSIFEDEKWMYVIPKTKTKIVLKNIQQDDLYVILAAIVLSLVFSIGITFALFLPLIEQLIQFNSSLLDQVSCFRVYSLVKTHQLEEKGANSRADNIDNLEDDDQLNKNQEEQEKNREKEIKSMPIMSFSSMTDYIMFKIQRNFVRNSLEYFFDHLFDKITNKEKDAIIAKKMGRSFFMIREGQLKEVYERFCYLNCLTQQNLSQGEEIFQRYGYNLMQDDERSQVIIGILKKQKNIEGETEIDPNMMDTLQYFMKLKYFNTGLETDFEYLDDIKHQYEDFCVKKKLIVETMDEDILNRLSWQVRNQSKLRLEAKKQLLDLDSFQDQSTGGNEEINGDVPILIDEYTKYIDEFNQNQKQNYKPKDYSSEIKIQYYINREKLNYHFRALTDPSGFIGEMRVIELRLKQMDDFIGEINSEIAQEIKYIQDSNAKIQSDYEKAVKNVDVQKQRRVQLTLQKEIQQAEMKKQREKQEKELQKLQKQQRAAERLQKLNQHISNMAAVPEKKGQKEQEKKSEPQVDTENQNIDLESINLQQKSQENQDQSQLQDSQQQEIQKSRLLMKKETEVQQKDQTKKDQDNDDYYDVQEEKALLKKNLIFIQDTDNHKQFRALLAEALEKRKLLHEEQEVLKYRRKMQVYQKIILYEKYWYFDGIYMWIHQIVPGLITGPIIAVSFIMMTWQSPFSIQDPRSLIFIEDFKFNFWTQITRIFQLGPFSLMLFFIAVGIIGVLLFSHLCFVLKSYFPPQIGLHVQLLNNRKSKISSILIYVQWIFIILCFAFVVFYICLGFSWLIFSAVIEPNDYMIFGSIILTLITFIAYSKKDETEAFEKVYELTTQLYQEFFNRSTKVVLRLLLNELQDMSLQVEGIMQSTEFIEAMNAAIDLGVGEDMKLIKQKVMELARDNAKLVQALKDEASQDVDSEIETLNQDMIKKMQNIFKKKCDQGNFPQQIATIFLSPFIKSNGDIGQIVSQIISQFTDKIISKQLIEFLINLIEKKDDINQSKKPSMEENEINIEMGCNSLKSSVFILLVQKFLNQIQVYRQPLRDFEQSDQYSSEIHQNSKNSSPFQNQNPLNSDRSQQSENMYYPAPRNATSTNSLNNSLDYTTSIPHITIDKKSIMISNVLKRYLSLTYNIHVQDDINAMRDARNLSLTLIQESNSNSLKIFLNILTAIENCIDGTQSIFQVEQNLLEILEIIKINPNIGIMFRVLISKSFQNNWKFSSLEVDETQNLIPNLRFLVQNLEQIEVIHPKVEMREQLSKVLLFMTSLARCSFKLDSILVSEISMAVKHLAISNSYSQTANKRLLADYVYKKMEQTFRSNHNKYLARLIPFVSNVVFSEQNRIQELANQYKIDPNILKSLSAICTKNYWMNFGKTRQEVLGLSPEFVKNIYSLTGLSAENIKGLIALIMNESREKFAQNENIRSFSKFLYDRMRKLLKPDTKEEQLIRFLKIGTSRSAIETIFSIKREFQEESLQLFFSDLDFLVLQGCPGFFSIFYPQMWDNANSSQSSMAEDNNGDSNDSESDENEEQQNQNNPNQDQLDKLLSEERLQKIKDVKSITARMNYRNFKHHLNQNLQQKNDTYFNLAENLHLPQEKRFGKYQDLMEVIKDATQKKQHDTHIQLFYLNLQDLFNFSLMSTQQYIQNVLQTINIQTFCERHPIDNRTKVRNIIHEFSLNHKLNQVGMIHLINLLVFPNDALTQFEHFFQFFIDENKIFKGLHKTGKKELIKDLFQFFQIRDENTFEEFPIYTPDAKVENKFIVKQSQLAHFIQKHQQLYNGLFYSRQLFIPKEQLSFALYNFIQLNSTELGQPHSSQQKPQLVLNETKKQFLVSLSHFAHFWEELDLSRVHSNFFDNVLNYQFAKLEKTQVVESFIQDIPLDPKLKKQMDLEEKILQKLSELRRKALVRAMNFNTRGASFKEITQYIYEKHLRNLKTPNASNQNKQKEQKLNEDTLVQLIELEETSNKSSKNQNFTLLQLIFVQDASVFAKQVCGILQKDDPNLAFMVQKLKTLFEIVDLEQDSSNLVALMGVEQFELDIPRFLAFLWVYKDKNAIFPKLTKSKAFNLLFERLEIQKKQYINFYKFITSSMKSSELDLFIQEYFGKYVSTDILLFMLSLYTESVFSYEEDYNRRCQMINRMFRLDQSFQKRITVEKKVDQQEKGGGQQTETHIGGLETEFDPKWMAKGKVNVFSLLTDSFYMDAFELYTLCKQNRFYDIIRFSLLFNTQFSRLFPHPKIFEIFATIIGIIQIQIDVPSLKENYGSIMQDSRHKFKKEKPLQNDLASLMALIASVLHLSPSAVLAITEIKDQDVQKYMPDLQQKIHHRQHSRNQSNDSQKNENRSRPKKVQFQQYDLSYVLLNQYQVASDGDFFHIKDPNFSHINDEIDQFQKAMNAEIVQGSIGEASRDISKNMLKIFTIDREYFERIQGTKYVFTSLVMVQTLQYIKFILQIRKYLFFPIKPKLIENCKNCIEKLISFLLKTIKQLGQIEFETWVNSIDQTLIQDFSTVLTQIYFCKYQPKTGNLENLFSERKRGPDVIQIDKPNVTSNTSINMSKVFEEQKQQQQKNDDYRLSNLLVMNFQRIPPFFQQFMSKRMKNQRYALTTFYALCSAKTQNTDFYFKILEFYGVFSGETSQTIVKHRLYQITNRIASTLQSNIDSLKQFLMLTLPFKPNHWQVIDLVQKVNGLSESDAMPDFLLEKFYAILSGIIYFHGRTDILDNYQDKILNSKNVTDLSQRKMEAEVLSKAQKMQKDLEEEADPYETLAEQIYQGWVCLLHGVQEKIQNIDLQLKFLYLAICYMREPKSWEICLTAISPQLVQDQKVLNMLISSQILSKNQKFIAENFDVLSVQQLLFYLGKEEFFQQIREIFINANPLMSENRQYEKTLNFFTKCLNQKYDLITLEEINFALENENQFQTQNLFFFFRVMAFQNDLITMDKLESLIFRAIDRPQRDRYSVNYEKDLIQSQLILLKGDPFGAFLFFQKYDPPSVDLSTQLQILYIFANWKFIWSPVNLLSIIIDDKSSFEEDQQDHFPVDKPVEQEKSKILKSDKYIITQQLDNRQGNNSPKVNTINYENDTVLQSPSPKKQREDKKTMIKKNQQLEKNREQQLPFVNEFLKNCITSLITYSMDCENYPFEMTLGQLQRRHEFILFQYINKIRNFKVQHPPKEIETLSMWETRELIKSSLLEALKIKINSQHEREEDQILDELALELYHSIFQNEEPVLNEAQPPPNLQAPLFLQLNSDNQIQILIRLFMNSSLLSNSQYFQSNQNHDLIEALQIDFRHLITQQDNLLNQRGIEEQRHVFQGVDLLFSMIPLCQELYNLKKFHFEDNELKTNKVSLLSGGNQVQNCIHEVLNSTENIIKMDLRDQKHIIEAFHCISFLFKRLVNHKPIDFEVLFQSFSYLIPFIESLISDEYVPAVHQKIKKQFYKFVSKIQQIFDFFDLSNKFITLYFSEGCNIQYLRVLIHRISNLIFSVYPSLISQQQIQNILNSIIDLYLRKPEEIHSDFFSLLLINSQYENDLRRLIQDIQKLLEGSQMVSQGLLSVGQKLFQLNTEKMARIAEIQDQLKFEDSVLTYDDIFTFADSDGSRSMDGRQLQQFLKRIGTNMTLQRTAQVIAHVQYLSGSSRSQCSQQEFAEIIQSITQLKVEQTLFLIRKNQEFSFAWFLFRVLVMMLVFMLILMVVQGFSLSNVFSSIINSIFPIIGAVGLTTIKTKVDHPKLLEAINYVSSIFHTDVHLNLQ